jgi:hypothetical protein
VKIGGVQQKKRAFGKRIGNAVDTMNPLAACAKLNFIIIVPMQRKGMLQISFVYMKMIGSVALGVNKLFGTCLVHVLIIAYFLIKNKIKYDEK